MITRNDLILIARDEMPSLGYDARNATGALAVAPVLDKMHQVLQRLLHYVIINVPELPQPAPAPAPAPAPRPTPQTQPRQAVPPAMTMTTPVGFPVAMPAARPPAAPQRQVVATVADLLPSLSPMGPQPLAAPLAPAIPAVADVPMQAGVANVVITPQGTTVVSPSGRSTRLPPGDSIIGIEATADIPPELPPPPPDGENVVLPPGGAMTPDVAAALAGRSDAPPSSDK